MMLLLLACVDYRLKGNPDDTPADSTAGDSYAGVDSPSDSAPDDTGPDDTGPGDTGTDDTAPPDTDPGCPDPWLGTSTVDTLNTCPPTDLTLVEEWYDPTVPTGVIMPVVGHLDDEDGDGLPGVGDIPEIVVVGYDQVVVMGGDGSGERWRWAPGDAIQTSAAIADLDADGWPEVITAVRDGSLAVLDGTTGMEKYRTEIGLFERHGNPEARYGSIGVWDLDADGSPEILCGQAVWSADGTLLFQLSAGTGSPVSGYAPINTAADLDGDGLLEIIGGNSVYSADGTLRWTAPVSDGRAAVADFDGDGLGEVVISTFGATHVYDRNGALVWTSPATTAGPAVIADFDGDGLPEVGAAGGSTYWMMDTDGTILWTAAIVDLSSGYVGSSAFDFDGDGRVEVVVADERDVRVFDGATGATVALGGNHCSGTASEYAPIVDVDGDGGAEIVVVHDDSYGGACPTGISVYGPSLGQFQPSTQWWNQYSYATVHVAEHGAIPAAPAESWRVHNTFRTGPLTLAPPAPLGNAIVDRPDLCDAECAEGRLEVVVRVGNTDPGRTLPAGIPVTVYGQAGALGTAWTTTSIPPGETAEGLLFRLETSQVGASLSVVVDDDGTGVGRIDECDEMDNVGVIENPCL